VLPSQTVTGEGVPKPAEIVDVVAIQKGSTDPERVIVLTGHIDSRVSDIMNATADAPGADDDASGVAVVIEAARILSRYKFPATIVYGVLSGEEQDLYGGTVLARGGRFQIMEGPDKFHRFVVIEFPSFEKGVACFTSKEYAAAAAFRRSGAGEVETIMVEGSEATK